MTSAVSARRLRRVVVVLLAMLVCALGIPVGAIPAGAVTAGTLPAGAVTARTTAAGPTCNRSADRRLPVLLVHGYRSGPDAWSAATRRSLEASEADVCLDVFDYADHSTRWVTDERIGPALARRIDDLADASRNGGGAGKVVVIAHSMGGLATRCAVSASCNGGRGGTRDHVAELITLGTPTTGSWGLELTPLKNGWRTAASLLSAACYATGAAFLPTELKSICATIRELGTSDATRAFKPGSEQLTRLPKMPSSIPVYAMAARVHIVSTFFGTDAVDAGDAGDLVVFEESALAGANKTQGLGGEKTIDCGSLDISNPLGAKPSCWHGTLPNDTRFLDRAQQQLVKVRADLGPPRPTAKELRNSSLPPGVCGTADFGWSTPYRIQLRGGEGSARKSNGEFGGASIEGVKVLGFADLDGDGRDEAVLAGSCYGSLPEQCCAGRASLLTSVFALTFSATGRSRLLGSNLFGGASRPGDEYGPADRAIRDVRLVGSELRTVEYVIYPDEYTAAQTGGRDPSDLVSARYRFSGGRWRSS